MKTFKKGQAATEFLMTYGWAILAIVIVAAVLWNMGIFKGSCTSTSPVQVFPSGSQLAVADWAINTNNLLNMSVKNLAGNRVTVNYGVFSVNDTTEGTGTLSTAVQIDSGTNSYVAIDTPGTGTAGSCFSNYKVTLTYSVDGGVSEHNITGTLQGKY